MTPPPSHDSIFLDHSALLRDILGKVSEINGNQGRFDGLLEGIQARLDSGKRAMLSHDDDISRLEARITGLEQRIERIYDRLRIVQAVAAAVWTVVGGVVVSFVGGGKFGGF